MKKLYICLFSLFTLLGFTQNPINPVSWNVAYVQTSNTEGELIFTALIESKWHIYSQRPTDAGPIPTEFAISLNPNYELMGVVEEKDAHEEYVAAFDAKVFVFSKEAVFKQKIKRKNAKPFQISSSVSFMTCNDMQCLPPKTVTLLVDIPAAVTK